MTTAPALFDAHGNPTPEAATPRPARWLAAVPYVGDGPIAVAFLDFHARHPEVYAHLVTLCRRARSRGLTRLGIGQLWEVLRWEISLDTLPDPRERFELNNVYRSRYARLIMAAEPDLAGVFETRRLRSEDGRR